MAAIIDMAVPAGTASGLTYFVSYEEDLWLGLGAERQEFCKQDWIKRATPTDGVRFVVLKLIPDPPVPRDRA